MFVTPLMRPWIRSLPASDSHVDAPESAPVTRSRMVPNTLAIVSMVFCTAVLRPFQMDSATPLIAFHAPDQSPLMTAAAALMTPLMTARAVSMTFLIAFHAPTRTAFITENAVVMFSMMGGPMRSQTALTPDQTADHCDPTSLRIGEMMPHMALKYWPMRPAIAAMSPANAVNTGATCVWYQPTTEAVAVWMPAHTAARTGATFDWNHATTVPTAVWIAVHAVVTALRNVSLVFQSVTIAATRAATAVTTMPTGLAAQAALRDHCAVALPGSAILSAPMAAVAALIPALTERYPCSATTEETTAAVSGMSHSRLR